MMEKVINLKINIKYLTFLACTRIVCPSGNSCFNGLCIPSSGTNCANSGECPDLHLCRDGRCVSDVCAANGRVKCPPEHACSPTSNPEGECRHFQVNNLKIKKFN